VAHVSPSQISTWRGCKRKWAYSRKRPRTQNRFAEFGTKMHAELEAWLRGQKVPDPTTLVGRTAIAGLPHLPMPKTPTLEVEQRINIVYENVHYLGFTDARWFAAELLCVNVADHKSCGSFDYCHTPETLEDDPQFLVYGVAGLIEHPDAIMVRGLWNYLQRATASKAPKANPVEVYVSAQTIVDRFIAMHHAEGKVIAAMAATDLPPEAYPREGGTNGECDRYGGCPYALECWAGVSKPVNVAAVLAAPKEQDDNG
jgi:hypothetical protein